MTGFSSLFLAVARMLSVSVLCASHTGLRGLRHGATAYVRQPAGTTAKLTVSCEPVWAWESCGEHFHVQAPDGELLARVEIPAGVANRQHEFALTNGPGDYRVSFSGWTYRSFALSTDPPLKMVFEPAPVHTAFSLSKTDALCFRVPEDTRRFTFCAKNQQRHPLLLSLLPPAGGKAISVSTTEAFKGVKDFANARLERDYFHNWEFDSKTLVNPVAGVWTVRFENAPKASVWVEGIPNFFAQQADAPFVPSLEPGRARIVADLTRVTGSVGSLGSSFPDPHVTPLIDERVRFLGLQSMCRYVVHDLREPRNDDRDPHHVNPIGFHWAPDDERAAAVAGWKAESLIVVTPAKWLGERTGILHGKDEVLEEYAEFIQSLVEHNNVERSTPIRYLAILDEPNPHWSADDLLRLIRIAGRRLHAHPDPRVRATRLMAPQSSMFLKHSAGRERSGAFFAERLYKEADTFVGGISFNMWGCRNLLDTWLYDEAVRRAAAIQKQFDSDGDTREPICIFQTNFHGGGDVSLQDTCSFYASLWWTSAVANAMKTGRMSSLNWFPMFDDPHHMKGLCYAPEKGGGLKPVGYAMKMLLETLLEDAADSSCTHPEVDEILTVSRDRTRARLLLVNKFARRIRLFAEIRLPPELAGKPAVLRASRMRDGDRALVSPEEKDITLENDLRLERDLDGQSVYVFELRRQGT